MRLSRRELGLAWGTGVLLWFALTYWFASGTLGCWSGYREQRRSFEARIRVAEQWVAQRERWDVRFQELMAKLPSYTEQSKAFDMFSGKLNTLKNRYGLEAPRRENPVENERGELREISVVWQWKGSLDSIVRFLYALQSGNDMMDVSKIVILAKLRNPDQLGGSFTVSYIYSLAAPAEPEPEIQGQAGPDKGNRGSNP